MPATAPLKSLTDSRKRGHYLFVIPAIISAFGIRKAGKTVKEAVANVGR
jgi:hypothetical protein